MKNQNDRAQALFKIRSALGWNAAKVAEVLDVGQRTVGLWETGAQIMPDARWRLFMHEVMHEFEQQPQLIVVFAKDGLTPIDVVSDANYVTHQIADDGKMAIIASYCIDRVTNRPKLHKQPFEIAKNKHVLRQAIKWDSRLRPEAATGEKSALAMNRWLTNRILKAEANNPSLRVLKDAITAANDEVDLAIDAPEKERLSKSQALDSAIWSLIREIENQNENVKSLT